MAIVSPKNESEQIRITYPSDLRDEVMEQLHAAGFDRGRYSGPVTNLCRGYDPNLHQHRNVAYREIPKP